MKFCYEKNKLFTTHVIVFYDPNEKCLELENTARKVTKSTACGCQSSTVWCLIEDKKSKSKKGHNSEKCILNCLP